MKARIFLTGLALVAVTAFASAQNLQGGKGNGNCNGTGKGSSFVDANKDGICDNQGAGKSGAQKGKRDGPGQGQGKGKDRNFVDANNNGVCDTYEARTKK
ncbi:MAG: hypothetical protein Q8S54_18385 [Bacteroidota bacterium]|nr:hypothetical protein [Odoribacter sp.]MDP3645139.1 hypothetical protein [Bacteroidota bacterium]